MEKNHVFDRTLCKAIKGFLQVFDWDYITSNDEIGEVQVIIIAIPLITLIISTK